MTAEQHIKVGRQTALISFLFGTSIFGLYFFTSSLELLVIGYGFIAFGGLINSVFFISILINAKKDNDKSRKLLMTCGIMLLNIPVMLFYCWIAIILIDTMRITFTNSSLTALTNINIVGCGGGYIEKLEVGESETVWVDITGDCSINIDYLSNGQQKKESVAEYVTSSMGQKMNHDIGGQNTEQF